MKKVLVTGASGFIGHYLVNELLKRDYKIIATASSAEKVRDKSWFNDVNFIPFNFKDYSNEVNYYDLFDQPDLMIHLAWQGLPKYKSLFHFETNLPLHYSLLKNMIVNGLKDLSVTGTCFEYGFVEGCLREEMKTEPANAYALAKDTLRKFLNELQKIHSYSLKWIRLFYMFGEGQNVNSIFSQLDKAISEGKDSFNMSGGKQVRDYLPVEKVAAYITAIALQSEVLGVINCCSGQPVQLKETVEIYLKDKGSAISLNLGYYPYLDYEPMEFWGDNKRLKTIISNDKFI
ncbi:MAG: NAD-dependent epimerase/dehydratase family protein [Bacteroidota bacterium]|nr:NAD-dependent epimerase/dehydratase family protein [Bacteroidota bacterium]